MYRRNLSKWVGLFVIVFAIFFGVNKEVLAEQSPNSGKCANADSTYNIKITNQMETGKHRIKLTSSNGKYNFNILILGDELEDLSKSEQKKLIKSYIENNDAKYNWDVKSDGKTFIIEGSDIEVYGENYAIVVYDTTKDICKNYYYKVYKVYSSNDESTAAVHTAYTEDIAAKNDSTPCGWAQNVFNDNSSKYPDDFKKMVKKAMVGCFPDGNGHVTYNLARSTLKKLKTKLKSYYDVYSWYIKEHDIDPATGKSGTLSFPEEGKNWVEIKDPKKFTSDEYKNKLQSAKSDMLTCEAKDEKTYRYLYYEKVNNYKTNYVGVDSGNNQEVCKSTCRESLVVSFGPPTAVVAGQCFTYEVEVKSTVQCVAEFNSNSTFPAFDESNGNGGNGGKNYIPNEFVPHCNNITGYYDQGGPTEDFDSCVKKCDGGKYSQSCIDKCYNETYNKNGTAKTSTNKYTETANKVNDLHAYGDDTLALTTDGVNPPIQKVAGDYDRARTDVREIYNNVHQYLCGYYSNNKYHTGREASHCGKWAELGYYYYRDLYISTHTYCNIELRENWYQGSLTCGGKNYSISSCSFARNGCYRGMIGGSPYIITGDGFKKKSNCPDPCSWTKKGDNYYDNRQQAEDDYVSNVDDYLENLKACMLDTKIKCKSDNVTFKMNVTGKTKSGDNNFGTSATHNKGVIKQNDGTVDKIIKFNGGNCVGSSADKNNNYMYHSILTFPGTWINNKSGAVVYDNSNIDTKWYTSIPGNYCTPLNAEEVNTKWWEWYVGSRSTAFTDTNSLTYNITSEIGSNSNGFGHYNWNFNLACYYGVSNKTCTGDSCKAPKCKGDGCEPVPSKCTGDGCDANTCDGTNCDKQDTESGIDKYTTRSITPNNLFPASGTTAQSAKDNDYSVNKLSYVNKMDTTSASAGSRKEGFNWSVNATNLSIKGYPVTPSSLAKKIEALGDVTKNDSEIDYKIHITAKQINKIKNDAKSYSGDFYTNYKASDFTQVTNGYTNKYKSVLVNTTSGESYAKYNDGNIPTYSYYRSSYLRDNTTGTYVESNGLKCNNVRNYTNCDLLSAYTRDDQELSNWLAN